MAICAYNCPYATLMPATRAEEQLANERGDMRMEMPLRAMHMRNMPGIFRLPILHTKPPKNIPPAVPNITTAPAITF